MMDHVKYWLSLVFFSILGGIMVGTMVVGGALWALRFCMIAAILMLATPAWAQPAPPPDPVFMARALSVLQAQRNAALDAQAVAEARALILADDVAKLQAKIEDLTKPKAPAAEPPK